MDEHCDLHSESFTLAFGKFQACVFADRAHASFAEDASRFVGHDRSPLNFFPMELSPCLIVGGILMTGLDQDIAIETIRRRRVFWQGGWC